MRLYMFLNFIVKLLFQIKINLLRKGNVKMFVKKRYIFIKEYILYSGMFLNVLSLYLNLDMKKNLVSKNAPTQYFKVLKKMFKCNVNYLLAVPANTLVFTSFFESIDPNSDLDAEHFNTFLCQLIIKVAQNIPLEDLAEFIQQSDYEISLPSLILLLQDVQLNLPKLTPEVLKRIADYVLSLQKLDNDIIATNVQNIFKDLAIITKDFFVEHPYISLGVAACCTLFLIYYNLPQQSKNNSYSSVNDLKSDINMPDSSWTLEQLRSLRFIEDPFLPPVLSNQNIFVISIFVIIMLLLVYYTLKQMFLFISNILQKNDRKYK